MHEDLVVDIREAIGHVALRPSGRLSLRTVPTLREALVKSLLNVGRVVVDLSRLRTPQAAFVTVFPAALAAAGGWPAARLVLFGAEADLRAKLASTRTTDTVPLAADLASALIIVERRPPEVRRYRILPMRDTAALLARLFVADACTDWQVPPFVEETISLVSSELVTNAVEHANSTCQLTLTCTPSAVRVSVRDFRPGPPPRPRPIDVKAYRGRGLHLVATLARSWGVDSHADGKTVWANLPLDAC